MNSQDHCHISTKTTLYFFSVFAVIISLSGCKPRQTTIAGQVFIVTAGRENVKLGGVRVFLMEKEKATNALRLSFETAVESNNIATQSELDKYNNSLSNIQLTISTLSDALTKQQSNVDAAQAKFNEAEQKYEVYMATQPLRTNAEYIKIYRDLISLLDSAANQRMASQGISQAAYKTSIPGTPTYVAPHIGRGDVGYYTQPDEQARIGLNQSLQIYSAQAETELQNTYAAIDNDRRELAQMYQGANETQEAQVQTAQTSLSEAQSSLRSTESALERERLHLQVVKNTPPKRHTLTLEDIFKLFTPEGEAKGESDANGDFQLTYQHNKKYTIYVTAERTTPSAVETYYWLIDAPSISTTTPILLDNNNLIEVDPNEYLANCPNFHVSP